MTFWSCIQLYFIASRRIQREKKNCKKRFEKFINKQYLSIQDHLLAVKIQKLFLTKIVRNQKNTLLPTKQNSMIWFLGVDQHGFVLTEGFTFWLTKENLYNRYYAGFVLIE